MKTKHLKNILLSLFLLVVVSVHAKNEGPNILLIIGDDISWKHFGCYGSDWINTPSVDALAKSGVKFNNAFAAAPGCSPSRAALLTGRYIWEIEEAGSHWSNFPRHLKVYPELFEKAGYAVASTGKPWAPGEYKINGREHNPAGKLVGNKTFEKEDLPAKGISPKDYAGNLRDFLSERPEGKPFCFWLGTHEAHLPIEYKSGIKNGKKPEDVDLPSFYPDAEELRIALSDFAIEVEWFDKVVGGAVEVLRETGELENTLIVVTADNGMPFPRAKANNYDFGVHMPLIISWAKITKGNRTVNDMVSLIDLAPTFLEAANLPVPEEMTGRSLLNILESKKQGVVDASRTYVLSGRERHGYARENNWSYPIRAMHTLDYTCIWNPKPERFIDGNADEKKTKDPVILALKREGFWELCYGSRPEYELYSRVENGDCLHNLAEKPKYQKQMNELKQTMQADLKKEGDPRVLGYGDIWESYPRYGGISGKYGGFSQSGVYNPEYVQSARDGMEKAGITNDAYFERTKLTPPKPKAKKGTKVTVPTVTEKIVIDKIWSAIRVGYSLLTDGDMQYIAYYNENRRMVVGMRHLGEKEFELMILPSEINEHPAKKTRGTNLTSTIQGYDSHNYITLAVDQEGYIHLSGNMHVHPLLYFRSTEPHDITTLKQVKSMVGTREGRCTYPKFKRSPNGKLIFHYRDGKSGAGGEVYNIYDVRSRTWSRFLNTELITGGDQMNAYQRGPRLGPDGMYHLLWLWRDTPDAATCHDLSYARSRDLVNWENAAGEPLELPLRITSKGTIIDPVPPGGGIINSTHHFSFDSKGRVVVTYHKHDEQGDTQAYAARFEGGSWKIVPVSNWEGKHIFQGGGSGPSTFGTSISLGSIRQHGEGKLALPFRHWKAGAGILLIDEETLSPLGTELGEDKMMSQYPPELLPVNSDFKGMGVRWQEDSGTLPDPSNTYVLRWETLGSNRDSKWKGPQPEN
ncbi:MAG: BNR-4 repeat-containing protein, partial [Bacteroidales bacterium]|nr:BNR-4 repeat-containing protein [Bacteroidales bacterium]